MSKQFIPMLISTAAIASSLVTPVAVNAQSSPQPIVCHVTIPLQANRQGSVPKLTYRLTGTLPQPTAEMPQNPVGNAVQITVQQHDAQGQIKTFLKRAALTDYGTIAPDADYSKLPFTGEFRAQPNNPERLYQVRGASHGLYISLRPIQGQADQMQIVHYLSPGKFVRSQAKCSTGMVVKLAPIQTQLDTKNWAAADRETRRIFDPQSVDMRSQDLTRPTPEMIRAIDQAWLEASEGRFGLTVQLRAWKIAQNRHPKDQDKAIDTLRDWVGWKLTQPRKEPDVISSDWRNESELNYALRAPVGHLPWVGVSDAAVQDVAIPDDGQSCGSCTIDAMALRSSRFYLHIPGHFARIEAALKSP